MDHIHNITLNKIEDYLNKIFDIQSGKAERNQSSNLLEYEITLERELSFICKLVF